MLPSVSSPKDEKKMDIARKVAAELFGQKCSATNGPKAGPTAEQLQQQAKLLKKRERGMRRTLKLISDPQCNAVYSMKTEMKLITERNIEILNLELAKLATRDSLKFSALVEIIDHHMQMALFGCSIDIGICTDSTAKVIEFFGDPNYRRKVRRGDSNCFTAIDRKDVVVEAIAKTKRNPLVHFAEGDHVVYVPMFGTSSAQGVMEIYGLQTVATAGPSHREVYQRSSTVLKAMIQAQDFKFVNTMRLWKKPPTSPKILEDGEVGKFYGVDAFIVAGHVTGVAHGRRGVPYYGGPRYTITWENGEVDEEIAASELLAHYKETPQSLGCSNTLDAWLSDNLYDIATAAGHILEAQRVKTFLVELRQRVQRNNMKSNIIAEIGLESIASMINGTREISLVGYNDQRAELNTLVDFFPVRNQAKGAKQQEQTYQHTVYTIGQLLLPRTLQSELLVVPDNYNTDWIALELEISPDFVWSVKANYQRYFVVMNRSKLLNNRSSELDLMVVETVVAELAKAIRSLWQKEMRKRVRKDVIRDLEQKMFEWKTATVPEICYNVIQHIYPHLAGADLYVSLVDPGGATMTFISASNKSKMEGKVLKRGEGVSFDVVDNLRTIVLRPEDLDKGKLLVENSIVDVYYGRKLHRARVEKVRGHEKFDVRYDVDRKVEAGVDASRIVPHSFAFRMKKFGKATYPFMCVALRNRSKALGVIGIDSFTQIPKAEYETHPEPDLIAFLEKIGAVLGSNIDVMRKKTSMQVLYGIAKNQFTEVPDIVRATFEVLNNNMTNVTALLAARLIYEDAEPKNTHGLKILQQRGVVPADVLGRLESFSVAKSSLKSVQKVGERIMWMLCRLRPATRTEQGKIFMFCVVATTPISEPDQEFLSAVQKLVAGTLQNIVSFKAVTEMRYEALREIRSLCETAGQCSRQKWFNLVVDSVQSCFYSANMYVGVLSPYNKSIDYILASAQSEMVGKSLVRADKNGVSFRIVDELMPVSVGPTSPLAFKLFHFGPRQQFEYPYIGIPLVVHVDAMIGVLGVDHCEDPAQVGDSLADTTSFFSAVGNSLGQVVRQFREEDARARLLQIGREAKTFAEGMRQIKKVILEVLPFARRIVEIAYEPTPAEISQRVAVEGSSALVKEVISQTTESYVVVLQVPSAFCTASAATNVQLKCIWQGNALFSVKIAHDGDTKLSPVTITIPCNVSLDIVKIQFLLIGTISSTEREFAHKEVDLVYLLNAPLYIMEHYFESTQNPTARVGKLHLLSKVFGEKQVVGFVVTEILIKGVTNLFDTFQAHKATEREAVKDLRKKMRKQQSSTREFAPKLGDVFSLLRWNDEVVLQTPAKTAVGDLLWANLTLYLKTESLQLPKNLLQLEVWDERKNGEPGTAYGRMDMDGAALQNYLEGNSPLVELGALFPEGSKTDATTASVMRTNAVLRVKGRVITAANMSEEHVKQEFSPSLRIKATESAASAEKERPFHRCEVCVLQARELGRRPDALAAGTGEPDVFAVVYFNGEEVGRSAVARGTVDPLWKDEAFSVRVPGDDEVDQCSLVVELYHLDSATSAEVSMGRVEVQGKALANFLTSNKLKMQWFDVEAKAGKTDTKAGYTIAAQGELKLSGRPIAVEVTGHEHAKELGHMEMSLLGFAHVRALDRSGAGAASVRSVARVYFNDRLIHRTKTATGVPEGQWEKEKVSFRYPNSKPLFQCKLKVELWQTRSGDAQHDHHETLVGSAELTGSALAKLMGQKGLITKWLPITSSAAPAEHGGGDGETFSPEVQVKGGPLGGKDIYEDCDEQLLLDVLAATRLPLRRDGGLGYDRRPCTFAEIAWNQKRIGRTAVVMESINPLWDRQRFVMRIPLLTTNPEVNILRKCKLRIDLYDVWPDGTELACGSLMLLGAEVEELFGQEVPNMKWYPLHTRKGRDGKLSEPDDAAGTADNTETVGAELKLRGAKTGVVDEAKKDSGENLLHILSARDLSNTDIFGGADPFVTVEWLGDAIGHTQIVHKSVNPVFANEVFVLKPRLGTLPGLAPPPVLLLSVFSKLAVSTVPVFLGRVLLTKSELNPMLAAEESSPRTFTMVTSPELTEEENQLVKGTLTIKFSKVKVFPHNIATKREAVISVVSAANLPRTSAFGVESDVFCKVYRRADREGGDDVEISETAVAKSLNPVFEENHVVLEVPAYDDWSGFQVRVEVWDAANEPLGAVILREKDAQALLGRDQGDLQAPVVFELMDSGTASAFSPPASAMPGVRVPKPPMARRLAPDEVSDGPTISLAGGIRELFDLATLKRRGTPGQVHFPAGVEGGGLGRVRSTSESDRDTTEGGGGRDRTTSVALSEHSQSGKGGSQKGDEAHVTIMALEASLDAKKLFCVWKWKGAEVGRTTPAKLKEGEDLPWSQEPISVALDKGNSLSSSALDIEIFSSHKKDAPLAVVQLVAADLAKLFDPAVQQTEFPVIDFKSSKSILGRKKVVGTVTLNGSIPRVKQEYDELRQESAAAAVVEQEDPELQPLQLELELQHLSKVTVANKQIFVSVYWCGAADPVGKTDMMASAPTVEFDCEFVAITKPQGVRLVDCSLRVGLYSKSMLTANTLLGEATLAGEALKAWVNAETGQEFALRDKSTAADAAPSLFMAVRKIPDTATTHMFNNALSLPSHLIEVEVNILAAHGLARVNTIGQSNPYCKLTWGRVPLGQTSVIHDTLAPMWEETESFVFRAPSTWDFKKGKRRQTTVATAAGLVTGPGAADMVLTLSMYSSNRLGEDVFLGSVEIAGEELAKFVSGAQFSRRWFNLRSTKRLKRKDQKFASGRVQVLVTHKPKAGEGDFAGKDVDIVVCAGRDLPKRKDNASVDVYIRPRWNGKLIGKTFHSMNSTNPSWEDERFHSRLPGSLTLEECTLELEVWQYQKTSTKSALVGVVILRDDELRSVVETSNFTPQWFTIAASPFTPASLLSPTRTSQDMSKRSMRNESSVRSIENSVHSQASSLHIPANSQDGDFESKQDAGLGQLQIRCGFAGRYVNVTEGMLPYELAIYGARDLGKADLLMGQSDPYVICKWNGREIGRTPHAQRTIHPLWVDQKFVLMLDPEEDIGQNLLQIEVWNHRVITKGEFLGCLYLTGNKLAD